MTKIVCTHETRRTLQCIYDIIILDMKGHMGLWQTKK